MGIPPESPFLDKSRKLSDPNRPMFGEMSPDKLFLERFRATRPARLGSVKGISPTNLLLERSMLFTSPRIRKDAVDLVVRQIEMFYSVRMVPKPVRDGIQNSRVRYVNHRNICLSLKPSRKMGLELAASKSYNIKLKWWNPF
ncbi:hypothetical protein RJ640_026062 [Escallonia rubra]|uniref:Uncharacterized protein n=1 Tax=Escallonia rubra TaxID=112253 RepID=A0AA88S356_9ASTE|nr:hypothetical protein RJ640_026062 [Escallonia rubra]